MLAKIDVARIYETVLSTPGMNETIKLSLNLTRKNVLLLSKIIERGISSKQDNDAGFNVLETVPEEVVQQLLSLSGELLHKAGLTDMNQKLQAL